MHKNKSDTQHSIYYKDDARTVLKKYRLRRGIISFIYIFLTLAFLVLMFTRLLLYQEHKYIWLLGFPLWFLFRGICLFMIQLQFSPVVNILDKDCDPEKLYDILSMFRLRGKKRDNTALFLLYKARVCYYIPERQEEGLSLIKQIQFEKPTPILQQMRLLCAADYAGDNRDKEWFSRIKEEFENLPTLYAFRKGNIRLQEEYGRRLRLTELFWDFPENFPPEKEKEARTLLHKLLSGAGNTLREVTCHFYLAKLDMAAGEYKNARAHLQYVVFYGGTLPLRAEADSMLKECEQCI
ncbi:MAG: hypothetical protein NC251_01600 [Lachnoclostridium sp.]|nr:hypothetical protein [Lachnospira sp.]MCM1247102.1 hypothetical protein [Lachnoclostridium sp.]MCM1536089.1 hypothetical protein [Clostridium sp.]